MPENETKKDGDRREARVTINKEFESFDAFIQEYVTNISRTGVFIKSKPPLAVGTKVNLRFTVIMEDIETVEGVGEVVRIEENPPGMGVVFREISAYSKGLIDRLLLQGTGAALERVED
jgi:PilZ domain